jgi:hypothetical protein
MPVHDWTRLEAGIFHHFRHDWITELARALNRGVLPSSYYGLVEQAADGLGPDFEECTPTASVKRALRLPELPPLRKGCSE